MVDNISSGSEQRQFSGGAGANNNSIVSRKKNNNGGGDLTASPKYNKSNSRGYNKEIQQQKQPRGNNSTNNRERGNANSKYRNHEQNNTSRSDRSDYFDFAGVDDENPDDNATEVFEYHDQYKRGGSGGVTNAKKTNMSHLLNFHYLDKQRVNVRGNRQSHNGNYYSNNRWAFTGNSSSRQSYSKEQFLQANCQFVVQSGSNDYSVHFADPDLAIDWSRVEQVRLHSMQPLKCPICLSEPQAGKITRCGHVYCWSCLLHYLALSDQRWRKCPVCSESIYREDIRSVRGIVSRSFKPGDWITFHLMCRERGSALFYPRKAVDHHASKHEPDRLAIEGKKQLCAHLLSADDETLLSEVIEKEKLELLQQLEDDGEQPEACFIKQALEENNEREKCVRERMQKIKQVEVTKLLVKQPKEEEEESLLPIKPAIVYDNAFDDIIEVIEEEKRQIDLSPPSSLSTTDEHSSQGASATTNNVQPNRHYFYQANDAYHAYLNGLNTRILIHEYGSYQQCPDELHVRVEAIESFFMTEDLRSQFRSLSHLPLTCEFQVIEIRLHPPLISPATMQLFTDEIHRRRQYRTRKERLEKRRQQQAEFAESQKLFSQYPPEMMYIPQEKFPVNGTDSIEEFPAISSSSVASSSPPSAAIALSSQISDENFSPPTGVSFAQMLKQQAPPVLKATTTTTINRSVSAKSSTIEIPKKTKKNEKKKNANDSDDDPKNDEEDYYASVPNFHSSFSLEGVFDRLKHVTSEEHPVAPIGENPGSVSTKKKNKKTKQVLFATGLGGQAKL